MKSVIIILVIALMINLLVTLSICNYYHLNNNNSYSSTKNTIVLTKNIADTSNVMINKKMLENLNTDNFKYSNNDFHYDKSFDLLIIVFSGLFALLIAFYTILFPILGKSLLDDQVKVFISKFNDLENKQKLSESNILLLNLKILVNNSIIFINANLYGSAVTMLVEATSLLLNSSDSLKSFNISKIKDLLLTRLKELNKKTFTIDNIIKDRIITICNNDNNEIDSSLEEIILELEKLKDKS